MVWLGGERESTVLHAVCACEYNAVYFYSDVCALEQALQEKTAFDERLRQEMEIEKEKVQNFYGRDILWGVVFFSLKEIGECIRKPVLRWMKQLKN